MKKRFIYSMCSTVILMQAAPAQAEPDMRQVVRSTNGHIVLNTFNNCVRSSWQGDKDACAPEVQVAQAVPPATMEIGQDERSVYFEFNKSSLTPEATQKLNGLAEKLSSDKQVREAKIVGFADRIGTPSYNEQLSKKRAEAVRRYLISRGFVNSQVAETRWLGEAVPVTQCPDTLTRPELIQCLQKDRRVEVEIEYQK